METLTKNQSTCSETIHGSHLLSKIINMMVQIYRDIKFKPSLKYIKENKKAFKEPEGQTGPLRLFLDTRVQDASPAARGGHVPADELDARSAWRPPAGPRMCSRGAAFLPNQPFDTHLCAKASTCSLPSAHNTT